MSSVVQSIIFEKKIYTLIGARSWLFHHGYKYKSVDIKPNTYRFRQKEPIYNRYTTIRIRKGIQFVLGFM